MSQNYDNRYVPATTREQEKTTHTSWRLTKSQYVFYYWLIANSCWSNSERHYYIYDSAWTKKAAAEGCGVSTKTIERAIPVLEANGIIRRSEYAKAYEIYWPYDVNVCLNKELLLVLISMNKVLDVYTLIKLFSLLLYAHHVKHLKTFTIVDLETALGMNTGVAEHVLLMAMLGLLEHWHLLRLSQEHKQIKGIKYIQYTIEDIHSNMDGIEEYIPTGNTLVVAEQWKKIVSTTQPLL